MRNQTKKTFQQILLLGVGIVSLFFAWVFWLITGMKPLDEAPKSAPVEDVQPQFQAEQVAATANLGVLTDEVRPLQQTTRVVASGDHGLEFRGTKFLLANQDQYSIELMRVSKEDIVRNFLAQQKSRRDFMYFRLVAAHQPEHYTLNYGIYSSRQVAEDQLVRLNLKLPRSVRPKVVELKDYVPFVNDMGMEELNVSQTLYAVKLKPAAVPAPIIRRVPEAVAITPQDHATTNITPSDSSTPMVKVP
ncbi:hypothetical protein [Acinetobacter sp. MD2]|uniref:hypothetical protein n=1 Tax=Acinetobacter sp. MD2 TaxID=2600066 RepID=UPI002D1F3BCF|nr:hypothetical protein [Acinetobacter sp. MD2]MEB3767291.1 hypothetical protein [Acinetobacter sp. MD2]